MTLELIMEYNTAPSVDQITDAWVDISAYVDWRTGVTIRRGRQDESAQVSAGSMSLMLNNEHGDFIPGNAAGAFYPDITIPLLLRCTVVDPAHSISSVRFTGSVESFEPEVTGANSDRWTPVTVMDPLHRLGTFRGIESFLVEEIKQDQPIAYYPCTDGRGSISFGDRSGNNQPPLVPVALGILGDLEAAAQEGPPGAPASTVKFTPRYPASAVYGGAYGKYLATTLRDPMVIGSGNPYALEFWMLIDDLGAKDDTDSTQKVYPGASFNTPSGLLIGGYYDCDFTSEAGVNGPAVAYGKGNYAAQIGVGSDPDLPRAYAGHLAPGVWHHCVITSDGGTFDLNSQFYLNGHILTGTFGTTDGPPNTVENVTDLNVGGLPTFGGHLIIGAVSHVAVYNTNLDSVRVLEHYIAGRTGFAGEQLDYRMSRLLRYCGITAVPTSDPTFGGIDVDVTPVVSQADNKATSLIGELVDTGQGIFFFTGTGVAKYLSRARRYTSTVLSLSAAPGTGDIGSNDIKPIFDTQRLLNDVSTSSGVGTVARVVDTVSQAARGVFEKTIDTVSGAPQTADETSRWVAAGRSEPDYRIPSVTVQLATRPYTFQAAVLAAEIWDRVTFPNLPTGYALGEQAIEGMNEKWAIADQAITFNLSPNAPQPATVYQVGVAGADEINTSAARIGY